MFLIFLGVALALGAGLLATASYSEGVLLAIRTAAQCIGWLFLLATAVGLAHLRRGAFGELGATMVSFVAGVVVLYMAHFQWETMPDAPMPPIRNAAAPELLPDLEPGSYKATLASVQIVAPASAPPPAPAPVKKAAPVPAVADVCASLNGVESLQCRLCGDETGLAWALCQERARLEYCEGAQALEALCPSAIPSANLQSPPG